MLLKKESHDIETSNINLYMVSYQPIDVKMNALMGTSALIGKIYS